MPELILVDPGSTIDQEEILAQVTGEDLARMMRAVGLRDPGPPIRIRIVAEGSPEARLPPSWSVAYAFGASGQIVLIPSRVPAYPDDRLTGVLRHEIAHVLIARAAGRQEVPRWFNEGLSIIISREWRLNDHAQLLVANLRRGELSLDELDRQFYGGAHSAGSAYALSAAFVRFLLDQYGHGTAALILRGVASGQSFESASRRALGVPLSTALEAYDDHLDLWHKWIPILSSGTTLWTFITLLALWAFRRRRARDLEIRERWLEEERLELAEEPREWIH